MDGDGSDEIILCHLPKGYTNPGGIGPVDVQVLSWNGRDFDLVSSVSFLETYMIIHVDDLNGDGRDEIAVLRSGYRGDPPQPRPPQLSVYAYTGSSRLAFVAEEALSIAYRDNLVRLWGQALPGGKRHLVVPIPVYETDEITLRETQYQGFRLEKQQLTQEREALRFDAFHQFKDYASLPLFLASPYQTMDVDGDGRQEFLRIENKRRVRFIRMDRPELPGR